MIKFPYLLTKTRRGIYSKIIFLNLNFHSPFFILSPFPFSHFVFFFFLPRPSRLAPPTTAATLPSTFLCHQRSSGNHYTSLAHLADLFFSHHSSYLPFWPSFQLRASPPSTTNGCCMQPYHHITTTTNNSIML